MIELYKVSGAVLLISLASAALIIAIRPPPGTHAIGLALAQEWARANGVNGHVQCRGDTRSVWICDVVPTDARPPLTLACYELAEPPRCDITRSP